MKNKRYFFISVFQLVVGLAAIVAFVVSAIGGEVSARRIVTLVLAVAFVITGAVGIIDNVRKN